VIKRLYKALLLGLFVGIFGVVASSFPLVLAWEEDVGLQWLFRLRGAQPAPPDVVVVSIDEASATVLELPTDIIPQWRFQHAALIERLTADGAAVIAFDMFFGRPQTEHDGLLADTIGRSGNVILASQLRRQPVGDGSFCDRPREPIEEFARNARATATFTLPVWPLKAAQFWAFKDYFQCDEGRSVGHLAQMPAVIVQTHTLAAYSDFIALLRTVRPRAAQRLPADREALLAAGTIEHTMLAMRALFAADPELAGELREQIARHAGSDSTALLALVNLYAGGDSRFLNFYGPSRTITTVSYYRVLRGEPLVTADGTPVEVRGKIVMVGYSARLQPEQRDGFPTVFSEEGLHLSGVEIGATAVGNLIEGNAVQPLPLPLHWAGVMLWGLLLGTACRALPLPAGIGLGVLSGPLYLAYAVYQFSTSNVWLPLMVPLFLQAPLAVAGAITWRYLQARGQRERIQEAFGYYLPREVVNRLASESADLKESTQLVYGTCLSTDAEQYTRLSETLPPEELRALMNAYYQVLFREVERFGGIVSDVVGDSMLAIWATPQPDSGVRERACRAAMAITAAVDDFNRARPGQELPTRLGLHSGQIVLGSIGAGQHYEYRAVGDIVNTASRVQGLNKYLGSRALVSAETLDAIDGIPSREIGAFLLAGKASPIQIHELLVNGEAEADPVHAADFVAALASFRQQNWTEAANRFDALARREPADNVARYYASLAREFVHNGAQTFTNGAIRIGGK
jgi:adenylate cyclase